MCLPSLSSRPALASFFRQWLGIDGYLFTNKDAAVYPTFTDEIRKLMADEADAFLTSVALDNGGGTFKNADWTGCEVASDGASCSLVLPAGRSSVSYRCAPTPCAPGDQGPNDTGCGFLIKCPIAAGP